MNTQVVIMAGGMGTRLWPASTKEMPKQFIDILGVGKSLLQLTVERFSGVCSPSDFWVVTSENYVDVVRQQLPEVPAGQILAEPEPRNTAPCIAYACWKIYKKYPDASIVVTPSDALVLNVPKFNELICKALDSVRGTDSVVTIGVKPTRPETGYGYICAEGKEEGRVVKVSQFKEKPDRETAESYLAAGNYFWNAGIFIWDVRTVISEFWKYAHSIATIMDKLSPYLFTTEEGKMLKELFPQCDKISIDYAIMEKTENINVVSGEFGWSDLGTWGAVKEHISADENGNSVVGEDVRLFDTKNCVVYSGSLKTLVVAGLDGYIVAEKDGQCIICRLDDEQNIRSYSQK